MEAHVLHSLPLTAAVVKADLSPSLRAQLSSELSGAFVTPSGVQETLAQCLVIADAASFDPSAASPGVYYFLTGDVFE